MLDLTKLSRAEAILSKDDSKFDTLKQSDSLMTNYYGHSKNSIELPINLGAKAFLILNSAKKDNIYLEGNVEDYQFQRNGSSLLITDSNFNTYIKLAINKIGDTLIFKNGTVSVKMSQDSKKNYYINLGGKNLKTTTTSFKSKNLKLETLTLSNQSKINEPPAIDLSIESDFNTSNHLLNANINKSYDESYNKLSNNLSTITLINQVNLQSTTLFG